MSGWDINFEVRPADPDDCRAHSEAHEVRMFNGSKPLRTVGVWKSRADATDVALFLLQYSRSQIR